MQVKRQCLPTRYFYQLLPCEVFSYLCQFLPVASLCHLFAINRNLRNSQYLLDPLLIAYAPYTLRPNACPPAYVYPAPSPYALLLDYIFRITPPANFSPHPTIDHRQQPPYAYDLPHPLALLQRLFCALVELYGKSPLKLLIYADTMTKLDQSFGRYAKLSSADQAYFDKAVAWKFLWINEWIYAKFKGKALAAVGAILDQIDLYHKCLADLRNASQIFNQVVGYCPFEVQPLRLDKTM